jgi:hypothetical protein
LFAQRIDGLEDYWRAVEPERKYPHPYPQKRGLAVFSPMIRDTFTFAREHRTA